MRILPLDKFLSEPDEVEWLVEGLLPSVGWTLLYGERGNGKTTFAIQLCMSLESGRDFLGLKTTKTHTMYIQADSLSLEWKMIVRRVNPKGGKTLTVVDVPERALSDSKQVAWLEEKVKQYQPGFIVFDSLYNLAGQSINNEGILVDINSMKAIAGQKPWLLIHHPPHDGGRAAGSNSIGGNCSNDWELLKTKLLVKKGRLVKAKSWSFARDNEGRWLSIEDSKSGYESDMSIQDILNKPFEI